MKFRFRLYIIVVLCFLCGAIKANKTFTTTITFPTSLNLNKVTIEYHNGLKIIPYKINTESHTQEFSDVYYSKYPVLYIDYNPEGKLASSPDKYFLEKNSSLIYKQTTDKTLGIVQASGAYALKDMGEGQFDLFARKELKNLETFLSLNLQYLNDSTAIMKKFEHLAAVVQKKKLAFIKSNSDLYYSLWLFKEEFASNKIYKAETLQKIYKQLLSRNFSGTWEGELVSTILNGRLNSFKGKKAPLFVSQDFKKGMVDLAKFRNEKYVILSFWASWCKPCLAEMPMLDSIHQLYSEDVAIISVSQDRIAEKSLKIIERLKMNWINIINDPMVESAYGNPSSLPQVYLINKQGQIIYSQREDEDLDLTKLFNIIKKL